MVEINVHVAKRIRGILYIDDGKLVSGQTDICYSIDHLAGIILNIYYTNDLSVSCMICPSDNIKSHFIRKYFEDFLANPNYEELVKAMISLDKFVKSLQFD